MKNPIKFIFDVQHLFTPFSVDYRRIAPNLTYRYIYIFGIRIASFNMWNR